jgi:hypothetical protein
MALSVLVKKVKIEFPQVYYFQKIVATGQELKRKD